MKRIAIIGITGAGKTTLGEQIARKCKIPHIDLDALYWGPNWTPTPADVFRVKVTASLHDEQWVTSGNYSKARPVIWSRADTLIWLDYSLAVTFRRLVPRTLKRVITRQELWHGNRETWREQFCTRDSIFLWAWQAHKRYRRDFPLQLALPEYSHLTLLRFISPRETENWLEELDCEPT